MAALTIEPFGLGPRTRHYEWNSRHPGEPMSTEEQKNPMALD